MTRNNIITLPKQGSAAIDEDNIFMPEWYNLFQDLWRGTRRNLGIKLGGIINIDTNIYENNGSSLTTLANYEIPANLFSTINDSLEFIAVGDFASNAHGKQIEISFGNQTILQTNVNSANGGYWQIKGIITRLTNTTQIIICEILSNNNTLQNDSIYPITLVDGTQDLSTKLNLSVKATSSSTGDVKQKQFIIKFNSNS